MKFLRVTIFIALSLLLSGCSNCEDALSNLKDKDTELKQSSSSLKQPLFSTIEHKLAEKVCDKDTLSKFISSLK